MTIQEYNDIYKNPIVKSMEITSSGGVTITNTNICMEQMSLEESLCSENSLVFGACESGCFKIRIADLNHNFEGEWLTVNQLVAIDDDGCLLKEDGSYLLTEDGDRISLGAHDNAIPYGRFKVFSDKPTNDRRWRDLTCYDAMYDILNAEVIDWYNGLTFPMTMKNFRDSFFTYLGITQETTTLVNDSFMIQGGFSNEGSLSGKTIITSICELNGVFGHISRQGEFEYISLPSADSLTLDWYMDGTGAYEDYTVQKITGITAKSSEEDVGTTVGTDTNVYIVQDNPLIYGSEGTQGLTTALTNLLNNVKDITYRPFNVNTYGNPMLPLGTNLTISTRNQTINSFLMTRVLSGIQSLKDSISADGEQYVPSQVNSLRTETKRTKGKIHELVNNVDELRSTIYDEDTGLISEIQQLSDEIVLKVDASGNIVKVALSANPSTGSTFAVNADNITFKAGTVLKFIANNIQIDSTYFKVDQYGNLTSTSGTIGGWEINSNGLRSEHDHTSYSTYMNLSSQLGEIEIGQNTDVLGNSRIKIDYDSISFLSDYANSGTEYNVLSINYSRGTTTGDVGNITLYDNYDNRHVSIGGSDGLRIFDNNTTKTHVSKDGFYDSSFLSNEVLVTNSSGVIVTSNISTTKLGYLSGVTSDIQTQLNGKQATITGGATSIVSDNLTASKALVSNANGKVAVSNVTDTELGYLSGATSNIQGQIDDIDEAIDDTLVTVSGNPITITDAANIPCESLTMTIEPIQSGSGTPSINNVRPITGLTEANVGTTGVNKFPTSTRSQTLNGVTITSETDADGNIIGYRLNGTATAQTDFTLLGYYNNRNVLIPSGTYKARVDGMVSGLGLHVGYVNYTLVVIQTDEITLSASQGVTYAILRVDNGTALNNVLIKPMFRPSTITDPTFVPYINNTATISFGGDTVYGGTVDFDTGILTLTWANINVTSGVSRYTDHLFYKFIDNGIRYTFSSDGLKCDKFATQNNRNIDRVIVDFQARLEFYTVNAFSSVADFMAYCGNSIQAVYKLATPQTVQLTPAQLTLLKGYNTVSANGKIINLSYQKDNAIGDIKKWVDEKLDYYSLEEQETNEVWIDGKRIYKKTFNLTLTEGPSTSHAFEKDVDVTDLNIDMMISIDGVWRRTASASWSAYYQLGGFENGQGSSGRLSSDKKTITLLFKTEGTDSQIFTIKYTKAS